MRRINSLKFLNFIKKNPNKEIKIFFNQKANGKKRIYPINIDEFINKLDFFNSNNINYVIAEDYIIRKTYKLFIDNDFYYINMRYLK